MLIIKALHIISMVTWFAGLFYLPRLFVYHAMSNDMITNNYFKTMERKLYRGIMNPSAIATVFFGLWLWFGYGFHGMWLHIKLTLVLILLGYHHYCGYLLKQFAQDTNKHSHIFYRWFNEFPVLILIACVFLVILKPMKF